jgi:hypothetical protein
MPLGVYHSRVGSLVLPVAREGVMPLSSVSIAVGNISPGSGRDSMGRRA